MNRDEIRNSNSLEANLEARRIANDSPKSTINGQLATFDQMGRSYYIFCLEQALTNIKQARALVSGDIIERNHELPKIERILAEAIDAS